MIHWEQLDPRRTERAIQMLLRKLYPSLRSFDGAGGDGGRDAQLVTADGSTVFEIKSFGRLDSSRRRQVERSLRKAVASAPDMTRWVLVIPMNMTPARPGARSSEEAWFNEKLQQLAPRAGLEWWGLDWLDAQLAENMDAQRYIEGVDGQVLQRSREFGKETDVLARGAEDLHARLGGLRRVVDEVCQYWTLDFSVRNGVQHAILRAKTPDAPILDPITITSTMSFRSDDAEGEELRSRFERTLDFGGRVDLPAGYVSKFQVEASPEARLLFPDRDPATSEFTFVTVRQRLDRPFRGTYQVLDGGGTVIAQFPVYFRKHTAGARGATLYGGDAAEIAKFEVGIPRPPLVPGNGETVTKDGASLQLELPDSLVGYDVDCLLPVLQVLATATEGTQLRLELPGLGFLGGGILDAAAFPNTPPIHQFVADLHRMQQLTGTTVRFPKNVTNGDVQDLRNAVLLLDGGTVEHDGGMTLNVRPESVGDFLATLNSAPDGGVDGGFLVATDSMEIQIGDLKLPYGSAAFWAPQPRLTNLAELEALADAGDREDTEVQARLEPTEHKFRWMPRQQAEEYFEATEHQEDSRRR